MTEKHMKELLTLKRELRRLELQVADLHTELDRMRRSRSWRLTLPLRMAGKQVRRLVQPKASCGLPARIAMSATLFPALVAHHRGVLPACKAMKQGKLAFQAVLENLPVDDNTPPQSFAQGFTRFFWAFALRIRRNGGIFPGLYASLQAWRKRGFSALFQLREPLSSATGQRRRGCGLTDALALLSNVPVSTTEIAPATVVVPVYNGLEHLEKLCPPLFAYSPASTKFVFVDDASPDPRVWPFLQEHVGSRPDCLLLRNETNLGFVKTINKGMSHVETAYAVWLNTDVVVPSNWLARLLAPFGQEDKIASTTPFSNCAVYFSYPAEGQDNPIPEGTTPEELDAAFSRLSPTITPSCTIHSGVGFCMGVNMACWQSIGGLDDVAFDRGYGEECDWCMRATSKGWRNVLVPNLFVYHAHGGSFESEEKKALCTAHAAILMDRWPGQMAAARQHECLDPWEPYRAMATLLLANAQTENPGTDATPTVKTMLLIDLDCEQGGACAYREKLITRFSGEGYRILLLQYATSSNAWTLTPRYLGSESHIWLQAPDELFMLASITRIDHIFVNNLAFCTGTEDMLQRIRKLKGDGVQLSYAFHDFYCLCPSFFLLGTDFRYCEGGGPERCPTCALKNPCFVIRRTDIPAWRAQWEPFLELCDNLYFFSQNTKDNIATFYPTVQRGQVIEHEPLKAFDEEYTLPPADAPLNIAFLGPFVEDKGKLFLLELADELKVKHPTAQLLTFGESCGAEDTDVIRHMGRYQREDLPLLLTAHEIKAVVLPSPSHETFSYIAQECMMLGVPFVCFDMGAPAERIHKYGYPRAATAPEFSGASLLHTVETLLEKVYSENNTTH